MTSSEPGSFVQKESKKRCYVSEVAKLLSCSLLSYCRSRLLFSIISPEIHDYNDTPDYKYDEMKLDFWSYLREKSNNDIRKTWSSLNAKQIEKSMAFRKFVLKLSLIMKSFSHLALYRHFDGLQKLWQPDDNESFVDDVGSAINEKHRMFCNLLRTLLFISRIKMKNL